MTRNAEIVLDARGLEPPEPMVRTRGAAAKAAGSESGKLVCGWFFIRKQTTASTTAAMTIISATAYGQMLPRTARPVSASKQT